MLVEKLSMFPSTSSLLSLYASFSTSLMLVRNVYHELVPKQVEQFIKSKLRAYFKTPPKVLPSLDTFIIDSSWSGLSSNKLIEMTRFYLSTKIGPQNKVIRVGKFSGYKELTAGFVRGEEIIDSFQGIDINWYFDKYKPSDDYSGEYFKLTFEAKHRDIVFNEYLKHVISTYKAMTKNNEERALYLYSLTRGGSWRSILFQHSASFDTIAMDSDLKKSIIEDIDRYLTRKDYYKRIGKAWKRGYLLYGPPGTGKSSLIAAMANYLKYDIYTLELSDIRSDYQLRNTLLEIERKSIIVIEDIDCNLEAHDRSKSEDSDSTESSDSDDELNFSLSSLLNCVDGLWSSSLEERIIVFTTNHKEVLDPALLRPGRMDMHIHMSYCTPQGFRVLVSNYLEIKEHPLFEEIDELIRGIEVTPASLAEELMKSEDADVALAHVVKFLNKKKIEKAAQDEEKAAKEQEMESLT
ncbi:P-loop containing nucleoside triphosphate hydrolases superfamily protein [Euphorbia peplus]|nr:P-loop containing nucleoside triphosphate hydrolases superfamily protein [Euphorbia peplus]